MIAAFLLNRWTLGLLALAASHAYAVHYGYQWADRSAEMAQLREQRDGLLQLWQTSEAARAADAQRLIANEAVLAGLKQKAEADADSLQDKDRECLSAPDADRLRQHFRTPR